MTFLSFGIYGHFDHLHTFVSGFFGRFEIQNIAVWINGDSVAVVCGLQQAHSILDSQIAAQMTMHIAHTVPIPRRQNQQLRIIRDLLEIIGEIAVITNGKSNLDGSAVDVHHRSRDNTVTGRIIIL